MTSPLRFRQAMEGRAHLVALLAALEDVVRQILVERVAAEMALERVCVV